MNYRTVVFSLLLSIAMTSSPASLAAEDPVLNKAIERTKAALAEKDDAHAFVVHLRNALRYANDAFHHRVTGKDLEAHNRLGRARPHLKQAIVDARMRRLDGAHNQAKEALEHLEAATK
ncbi:small metal-binding protein SmbP [Methylocystis heyeri]|uniref:Small metal-binding protein n=1 Tax=Methylocystis heyeri TaxID=391905 RepID=A0A6B8KD29_9HYPH|nr:small metal-binding protein SmbP [Methylocystis heyeri]QGM45492.1 hypothetical protein H2LOC_007165 [Methylocystis heyeri]